MNWGEFENELLYKHIHTINNNSNENIVLFGSCHMATIGYMLNKLLHGKYNIHIILSWFFENRGVENFDMGHINGKIHDIITKCNVFIYHMHINDYHVNAIQLPFLVNESCVKLIVPNYRLDYGVNDASEYSKSLEILKYGIEHSSFPECKFVTDTHKDIMFFNTRDHPTHYLLFLQSQFICNKIVQNEEPITIANYFDQENRRYFEELKNDYVILPGKLPINAEISAITSINIDADYYDR